MSLTLASGHISPGNDAEMNGTSSDEREREMGLNILTPMIAWAIHPDA